jgi:hypothetical protein
MQDFIPNAILWTLALYGLIEIAKTIRYYFACTKFKQDGIYLIIAAKNQEDRIECFTRNIICKLLYGKEELTKGIIMVDLDSTDDTYEIISKLAKDYNFIKASDWNECKEIMDEISK